MEYRSSGGRIKNRIALYGMLIAASFILSYIESLIPFYPGVPGIKMGLANLAVLVTIYTLGAADGITVSLIRIALVGFTFGNLFSMVYALAGGLFSLLIMLILKKTDLFGITGVSMAGAVAHNTAQIFVAMLVLRLPDVLIYLPYLILSGTLMGALTGITAEAVTKRLKKAVVFR